LSEQLNPTAKPNIIFILIDDMGWMDIGCNGSSFYETPNIDRIAKDGMRFTDAYASCPVCSPTRASLMTGKYPATLNLTDYISAFAKGRLLPAHFIDHLPLEEKSIASALKEAGYRTYCVGKWHLGDEPYWPEHHGFDVNIGGCSWGNPKHGFFSPYRNPRLLDGPRGEYLTDRLTNEAINLIKDNGDAPFFLYMSHYAVHFPLDCPQPLIDKYKQKAAALGLDKMRIFEKGELFPVTRRKNQHILRRLIQSHPAYAGMIENLDTNTGKLLQALEVMGKTENTMVIFYSDNGGVATYSNPCTSNKPLSEGKGWMEEGGTRVPLLIKWPNKIKPGSTCSVPVTSTDFYPTFLEMAHLPLQPNQHKDGVSILQILLGKVKELTNRKDIFWHYPHYSNLGNTPGASIRSGDYKLIQFFEDNHLELYNLREDIAEKKNISSTHSELVQELKQKLENWQKSVNAQFPTVNPGWKDSWKTKRLWKKHLKRIFDQK
jgi:arylsulfatase A-like enzyme